MKTWRIDCNSNSLTPGTPVEIFNWGEYPGVSPDETSAQDEVYVIFAGNSRDGGVISNATNQMITLALQKAGEIQLEFNSGTRLIDTKSELKHTEWFVI